MVLSTDGYLLDFILVPIGAVMFISYHIFLLVRVKKSPLNTVIGYNHFTR